MCALPRDSLAGRSLVSCSAHSLRFFCFCFFFCAACADDATDGSNRLSSLRRPVELVRLRRRAPPASGEAQASAVVLVETTPRLALLQAPRVLQDSERRGQQLPAGAEALAVTIGRKTTSLVVVLVRASSLLAASVLAPIAAPVSLLADREALPQASVRATPLPMPHRLRAMEPGRAGWPHLRLQEPECWVQLLDAARKTSHAWSSKKSSR